MLFIALNERSFSARLVSGGVITFHGNMILRRLCFASLDFQVLIFQYVILFAWENNILLMLLPLCNS